jgi:hypothetical protein
MAAAKRPTRAKRGHSGSDGWWLRPIFGAISALTYYIVAVRPWLLRWGATVEEASSPLPGDELVPEPVYATTRAVTVRVSAESIWPWLVQLGQGRAGFYTYDLLEQIVGAAIRSADRIVPELQQLAVGDTVLLSPVGGAEGRGAGAGARARAVADNGPAHRSIDPACARNPLGDGLDLVVRPAAAAAGIDAVAGAYARRLPAPRCPGARSPIAAGAHSLRNGARHAHRHQAPG